MGIGGGGGGREEDMFHVFDATFIWFGLSLAITSAISISFTWVRQAQRGCFFSVLFHRHMSGRMIFFCTILDVRQRFIASFKK